jgi:hypothetical protein
LEIREILVPRALLNRETHPRAFLSYYELSTTGWGGDDEPKFRVFADAHSANVHARDEQRKQLAEEEKHLMEYRQILYQGSEDSEDEDQRFVRVPFGALFSGSVRPGQRRSRRFRAGFRALASREDREEGGSSGEPAATQDKCTTEGELDGFHVGYIYNYHGDHMDGCGNPEMEHMWWVDSLTVDHTQVAAATPTTGGNAVGAAATATKRVKK